MAVSGTAGGRIAPGVGANLIGMHAQDRNQDATIYVGNLDPQKQHTVCSHAEYLDAQEQHKKYEVSEELAWELFSQAGPVVNVYLPKDRVTNQHQGYGFIEFRGEEDAEYSIKILNMIKMYGKPIRVNKASQDKKTQDVGANIFIGNLDPDVDEKLLYDTFSAFGVIIATPKIMRDPDSGGSKGYGFISYDCFEASDSAIEALNGQYYNNRPINVSYAFKKDTRGERHGTPAERQLAAQQRAKMVQQNRPHTLFASAPKQKPQEIQEDEDKASSDKEMEDEDQVEAPPAPPPPPPPSGPQKEGPEATLQQRPSDSTLFPQQARPMPPQQQSQQKNYQLVPPGQQIPGAPQPPPQPQQQPLLPHQQGPPQQGMPPQPQPHQQRPQQIGQQGLQIQFQQPQGIRMNPQRPPSAGPRPPIQPQQQPSQGPRLPTPVIAQPQQPPQQQGPRPPQQQIPQHQQQLPRPPQLQHQQPPQQQLQQAPQGPRPPMQQGPPQMQYRGPPPSPQAPQQRPQNLPPPPHMMQQGGPPPPGMGLRPHQGYPGGPPPPQGMRPQGAPQMPPGHMGPPRQGPYQGQMQHPGQMGPPQPMGQGQMPPGQYPPRGPPPGQFQQGQMPMHPGQMLPGRPMYMQQPPR